MREEREITSEIRNLNGRINRTKEINKFGSKNIRYDVLFRFQVINLKSYLYILRSCNIVCLGRSFSLNNSFNLVFNFVHISFKLIDFSLNLLYFFFNLSNSSFLFEISFCLVHFFSDISLNSSHLFD